MCKEMSFRETLQGREAGGPFPFKPFFFRNPNDGTRLLLCFLKLVNLDLDLFDLFKKYLGKCFDFKLIIYTLKLIVLNLHQLDLGT